jgi:hypothetical protein
MGRGTITQSSPFAKSAQGKRREEHRGHRVRKRREEEMRRAKTKSSTQS